MSDSSAFLGWDIGGVNIKAARLPSNSGGSVIRSISLPFEMQREAQALGPTLLAVARQVGGEPTDSHAVTMTAELSQAFRTKREGRQGSFSFPRRYSSWIRITRNTS